MRALLCTRLGPPESLVLTERLPSPKPSAGEVKLKILVAGINFPDTLIIGAGRDAMRRTEGASAGVPVRTAVLLTRIAQDVQSVTFQRGSQS